MVTTPAWPTLSLRPANSGDLPYLRSLYAASRAAELASVPWTSAIKRMFCDSQFDLQHRHYVTHFQPADFHVVLVGDTPVGRLYLYWPEPTRLHVVDILLEEDFRGQGIGTALLRALQDNARREGMQALSLHVEIHNTGARALYEKLAFTIAGPISEMRLPMTWSP